VDDVGIATV